MEPVFIGKDTVDLYVFEILEAGKTPEPLATFVSLIGRVEGIESLSVFVAEADAIVRDREPVHRSQALGQILISGTENPHSYFAGPCACFSDGLAFARLEDGEWVVEKGRWGLVPYWRSGKPLKDTEKGKGDGWKMTTFNARCEGVATAFTFKGAFARRRCIVPATAWYEWTGDKGSKTKHTFRRSDDGIIWFAGIWDKATTTDAGEVTSFTILTGPSEGMLADYHTRAPVILEPDDFGVWMDPANDPAEVMAAVRAHRFGVFSPPLLIPNIAG